MLLAIEVVNPGGMPLEQLLPGLSLLEVVVGHASLDVEVRLDIGLPGLPALDLLLLDPERGVDRQRSFRLEDAPAIWAGQLGPVNVQINGTFCRRAGRNGPLL